MSDRYSPEQKKCAELLFQIRRSMESESSLTSGSTKNQLRENPQADQLLKELKKTAGTSLHAFSGAVASFRHHQSPWKHTAVQSFPSSTSKVAALGDRNLEREVRVTHDVPLLMLGSSGLLVDDDHHLLRESVFYDEIAIQDLPDLLLPKEREIEEPCVSMCGVWCFEFWHWVLEYLPRLLLAEAIEPGCVVLLPKERPSYASESLEALGVSSDRIVEVEADALALKRAIVPERLCASNELLSVPSLTMGLRDRFSHLFDRDKPRRKIYVSRKKAQKRRIVNEPELLKVLSAHGFEEVILEEMSFQDQIRLHSETKALVGLHGAGMVHTLFMPHKSFVMEIFPKTFNYPNCPYAQHLLEHEYVGLEEQKQLNPEEQSSHRLGLDTNSARDRDTEAPVDIVEEALLYFKL